jgi:hypothetical protein
LQVKNAKPVKFITFDIETILKDGVQHPYLYSMFDGKNTFSWFTSSPKPKECLFELKNKEIKIN